MTDCSFVGHHDGGSSIFNCIKNIIGFSAGTDWRINHTGQHLSDNHIVLLMLMTYLFNPGLNGWKIIESNVITQVTSGDDNDICQIHKAFKMINSRLVFDLGIDFKIQTLLFKNMMNLLWNCLEL